LKPAPRRADVRRVQHEVRRLVHGEDLAAAAPHETAARLPDSALRMVAAGGKDDPGGNGA
jgi:hypothetical protein